MKTFCYIICFILLDAIVPRSCRSVRDPYYPEGYDQYEMIDQKVAGMELSYQNKETNQPYWSIRMTQDSVVLYVDSFDSTSCYITIPFTPSQFYQFRDSLKSCHLTYLHYEQLLPYMGLSETSFNLIDADGDVYYNGIHLEANGEYYYNFNGDIQALRNMFTGLFPEQMDGDNYISK